MLKRLVHQCTLVCLSDLSSLCSMSRPCRWWLHGESYIPQDMNPIIPGAFPVHTSQSFRSGWGVRSDIPPIPTRLMPIFVPSHQVIRQSVVIFDIHLSLLSFVSFRSGDTFLPRCCHTLTIQGRYGPFPRPPHRHSRGSLILRNVSDFLTRDPLRLRRSCQAMELPDGHELGR